MLRIRGGRENRENKERKQREEGEKRREEGEKAETENEQWAQYIMFSVLFNTWNCLYIDNMCSTSRLGLKPSKPTISL